MERTGVITKSFFKNEWNNPKGGIIYYHDIQVDNGDVGSCGTKTKEPDKLKVGQTIVYELNEGKFKLINPNQQNYKGGGGSSYKPTPYEHLISGMSVAYSKDLVVAGKVDIKDILDYSEKLYQWMLGKKIVEISASKEENKPISTDPVQSEAVNGSQVPDKSPEKWLNVTNGEGGDYTMDWLNVQSEIKLGRIKQVADVRKLYKVSKPVAEQLENLLRFNQ